MALLRVGEDEEALEDELNNNDIESIPVGGPPRSCLLIIYYILVLHNMFVLVVVRLMMITLLLHLCTPN